MLFSYKHDKKKKKTNQARNEIFRQMTVTPDLVPKRNLRPMDAKGFKGRKIDESASRWMTDSPTKRLARRYPHLFQGPADPYTYTRDPSVMAGAQLKDGQWVVRKISSSSVSSTLRYIFAALLDVMVKLFGGIYHSLIHQSVN